MSSAFLALAESTPRFDVPVRCDLGRSCFIQNYFDHAEGSAYKDYRCGHLSYDGHNGTDFRVINEIDMRHGVEVVASESGRVIGMRDGEPDSPISLLDRASIRSKEAGNGVVIDHGNGWHTQYSHLRKGSVLVAQGDLVTRGQTIGLIGESGNADFPHVEFIVRRNGKPIDPFWPDDGWTCGAATTHSLWKTSALKKLAYIDTTILQAGFSDKIPTRFEVQSGYAGKPALPNDSTNIFFWGEVMGANSGDEWRAEILAPDGGRLMGTSGKIDGDRAIVIVGTKISKRTLPLDPGSYQGSLTIKRREKTLDSAVIKVSLVECSKTFLSNTHHSKDYQPCISSNQQGTVE